MYPYYRYSHSYLDISPLFKLKMLSGDQELRLS